MALQHLRSSTADKRPDPTAMADGQFAINTESNSPGVFFKDSAGGLVKVGPAHIGTTAPNATPAGESGNSAGEFWLDTTGGAAELKLYDGSGWTTVGLPIAGGALTGDVTLNAQSDLRFADSDSSNWVAFQAPATIASNVTWTLPSADGTANQVLQTDGSGTLSWATLSASTDIISEGNTSAEVIDTGSDGRFVVTTDGTEALRVDNQQRVGIGTTSPGVALHVDGDIRADGIYGETDTNTSIQFPGSDVITFNEGGSEAARIDSSGRLLVGTSSARNNIYSGGGAATPTLQLENNTNTWSNGLSILNYSGSQYGASLALGMSASNTPGTNALVTTGNLCGRFHFLANDGTNFYPIAEIGGWTDGTTGTGDVPGRLTFSTTADGASSPTERMRITNDGDVFINKTGFSSTTAGIELQKAGALYATRDGGVCGLWNRLTSDGDIIVIQQASVTEGSISVSGTTVSYNGAHLSRWSQLSGIDPHNKDQRPEILRGTVMSNLDEMCEWIDPETGEPQANEQLNKTKISDVEGDKDVAGIFQSWDDDDDTWVNDFYLAMTGDMIIRIGAGVVVQRGDLLMSAGDGTAKPQDDDIIRSKTIAKVTSTNVTCTYDDGSYCVPCVLMAC